VAGLVVLLVLAPALMALWFSGPAHRMGGLPAFAGAAGSLLIGLILSALVATGRRPQVGDPDAPWLRIDALSVTLALVVALLGVTVLAYASRNLQGDPMAWRFMALANGLLASTLLMGVAARFSVLALGWVLTSGAVVGLIAYRGDPGARAAARRTATALGCGDLALVAALVVVLASVGDPDLRALGDTAADLAGRDLSGLGLPSLSLAPVVALLLVVAAAARAAQLPFLGWLTGTLAAPTPVSALLHAGAVNAGGFLLIRFGPLLEVTPSAARVMIAVTLATIVIAAGAALIRPDVKGSLAASTSAQMGFMLLAVAVGAPAAAMSHLVGHALYKSTRFLGAGDAIGRSLAARRSRRPQDRTEPAALRTGLALLIPVVALAAVGAVLSPSTMHGADGWIVGTAVLAAGVQATWSWLARWPGSLSAAVAIALATQTVAVAAYLLLASALGHALESSLVEVPGPGDAPVALAMLGGLVALGWALARGRSSGPWLFALLAGVGRPPSASTRQPTRGERRAPQASDDVVPAVGGLW